MNAVMTLLGGHSRFGIEIKRFSLEKGKTLLCRAGDFAGKIGLGYALDDVRILTGRFVSPMQKHTGCILGGTISSDLIAESPSAGAVVIGLAAEHENILHLLESSEVRLNERAKCLMVRSFVEPFFDVFPASLTAQLLVGQILQSPHRGMMNEAYMELKGMELVLEYLRQFFIQNEDACSACTMHDKMNKAWQMMMENMEHPLSISQIARAVGMSETNLKRNFRSIYGDSIFSSFQRHRMSVARKMLEEGAETVSEVAYRVGYNSPGHFSRAFSHFFGFSPRECREKAKTDFDENENQGQ